MNTAKEWLDILYSSRHGQMQIITADEIEAIQSDAIADLKERVSLLEKTFQHTHASSGENDCCAKCGLDLRDEIHTRI